MKENLQPHKTVETLVQDIYSLVQEGFTPKEENLKAFSDNVIESITRALKEGCKRKENYLRMSNLGTPNRKLWYTLKDYPVDEITPPQALSFIYGHIIEEFLLLLAKEAGHVVTDQQKEVELDGVKGHLDCKIDGVLVDVKGMSNFGFQKFAKGNLKEKDSFGYIPQISGYAQAENAQAGAFFVFNKERGTLTLFVLEDMDLINAKARIKEVKEIVEKDNPPQRCYAPKKEGESGNLILQTECTYCPFKDECWKEANNGQGIRRFKYSNGTKYFVKIVKEPRVDEIFKDNGKTTEEEVIEAEI